MDDEAAGSTGEETPEQKFWGILGGIALLGGALGVAYWMGGPARAERQALKKKGQIISGRLTKDADILCRHGRRSVKYEYEVEGKTYTKTDSVDCDVETGAEPEVIYLPSDPNVSRLAADNKDILPAAR